MRLSNVIAPRDREFFDLFEEAGGNILRAAGLLEEMLLNFPERNELSRDILLCEQEGDRITHDILQRLNKTFRHADRPRGHPRAGGRFLPVSRLAVGDRHQAPDQLSATLTALSGSSLPKLRW